MHHYRLHQITIVLIIHNHIFYLQHLEQFQVILQILAWSHFIISCLSRQLHSVSAHRREDAVVILLITEPIISSALNSDTFTEILLCVSMAPHFSVSTQWVLSLAVIMSTKPHSLHENWLCPILKYSITRVLIWLNAQLPNVLCWTNKGRSFLFIFLIGTIQTLWFKRTDGWFKGLEMRMAIRQVIWVRRVSSVPVFVWKETL